MIRGFVIGLEPSLSFAYLTTAHDSILSVIFPLSKISVRLKISDSWGTLISTQQEPEDKFFRLLLWEYDENCLETEA
jgi:hypothetical protein